MRALLPSSEMVGLKREVERLFDRFWEDESGIMPPVGNWAPALDVSETKEAFVAKIEIPGIDPKDVKVSLQDQVLTIHGEKKAEKEDKEERYYRMERCHGTFTRSFRLPVAVDKNKVLASFRNGLLTVTLPKTEVKETSIPIRPE